MQAYVEMPALSRSRATPSSLHSQKSHVLKTPVAKGKLKRAFDEEDEPDLGGYGSPEEDFKPRKTSMSDAMKSSPVKRTGDRDERGKSL